MARSKVQLAAEADVRCSGAVKRVAIVVGYGNETKTARGMSTVTSKQSDSWA